MKKRFLLFLAGIVLVFFVMSLFDLPAVVRAVASANPLYIAAAAGLQLTALVIQAARARIIGGFPLGMGKAFRASTSGNFVSLVTPVAKIGGEPLKIYILRNSYGNTKATAVIAVDNLAELLANIIVIVVAVLFFAPTIAPQLTTIFAAFIVIVLLILAGVMKLMLTPSWLKRIVDWFLNRISKYQNVKRRDYARMFYEAFAILLKRKGMMATAVFVSVVIKFIEFGVLWLAFSSIGIALPWREVVILWSIIVVFLFIPWLPGSLGLVEFGATSALVIFGLSSTTAASGILISRFISLWFVLFMGVLALYWAKFMGELPKGISLKDVNEKTFKIEKGNIGNKDIKTKGK
jgi:uncharacterized protein (TIRG00374 family)